MPCNSIFYPHLKTGPTEDSRFKAIEMTDNNEFKELREKIDVIDQQIQDLINRRVEHAVDIAKIKQKSQNAEFYKPDREAQVLREVINRNQGPMPDEEMARVFREIMSATLSVESQIKVAALGPIGTYTQTAAQKHFGKSAEIILKPTIEEVFRAVQTHDADYGVVPVENSSEGAVTHTLDLMMETPLKICGEVELRIRHCLLSQDQDLSKVIRVFSHSQSLAQCRRWLSTHLSMVEKRAVASNAEAAEKVSLETGTAAIASKSAAEVYGLNILAEDIEDNPGNTTRFLLIGHNDVPISGDDKTSLLIAGKNKPGILYKLLEPFAVNGLDMTRIESRPSRTGLWEYVFFIDIKGHAQDQNIAQVLGQLEEIAGMYKVLGSYPAAVL